MQVWASFAIALTATGVGIVNLPVTNWVKGYMGMGVIFTVGSSFSLAKTLRDRHEAEKLTSKVEEARVERILTEHKRKKAPTVINH
ncbi:YiaA/YiaB family inner membrane protein [Phormidium pseudopriestleyi]|uniref:YiaA/YiaB family inner membrane protein n=1 Tax=Phormidium pseudopriestleyi TaxID=1759527 RepID=UPI0030F44C5F